MFDNPSKNLQRLQDELLAAEEPQWEAEPEEEDPDQAYQDVKQILARDDWNETQREPLYYSYIPEEPVYEDEGELEPEPIEKKKGGSFLLILMLILNAITFGALAAVWWTRWR